MKTKCIHFFVLCLAAVIAIGGFSMGQKIYAVDGDGYPLHEPLGEGIGVKPGRVVWSHNPKSVEWDGKGYWWQPEHFDERVIRQMVDESVAKLADKTNAAEAWPALFENLNTRLGKSGGYKDGEKIAIKVNINGSAVNDDDTSGETKMSYTNPVLLKALLTSLVEEAGIKAENITVYDVSRLFPDYMVKMCTAENLKGVNFVARDNATPDENAPIKWSYEFGGNVNYLPKCVTEASYIINLANLKGHSYGITLCAKNHFGSFINGNSMRPPEGANLHQWLTKSEMGIYSPLADLTANADLGGKTLLYMLDAIICAVSEGSYITEDNSKWRQPPFDGDYTSSIFVSQDPVAIDSVGADFLMAEPTVRENNYSARDITNENYLHEAGLVKNAPSGTVYTNGKGEVVTNLGVHEHWNNSKDKQYGRNLGKSEGIELIELDDATPKTEFENGKIKVKNASENGTLIVAYYRDNILAGVKIGQSDEAELLPAPEGANGAKAFYWDLKKITPLGAALDLPLEGK